MIGRTFHDRYRIDSEIGQGGMGTVYRGYDRMLEREVAIKVLSKSGLGTEGRGKLLSEAQTAAKLNHPNIVTVHDVGKENETPFIVMEYVEGESLHANPPESLEEILVIIRQVCAGLEHAHGEGIIHRDLKPENVVITSDGTAKLMDFGLARSVTSRYTMDGTVAGTVFYLAPEQALGQEIDERADLYSLGVMLYELTTGELPFVDQDPIAVITQHLHAPVVPPRAKREAISPALNELILNLMSKDPRDRPVSLGEVLTMLELPEIGQKEIEYVKELSLLDRIVRGRMVGRERELNQARQLWKSAASGAGELLLISGEPGIGKTRLTREIATQAEVSGGQVLVGECHAEGNAPYAPFAQITRRALRTNGYELPRHVMAELLALSPELRPNYPEVELNPKLDPEAEQRRLMESMVEFCSIVCQESPLLLVLEDVHWADSGSLHMLEHLARRTRQQPVMLMSTYREVELDEALPLHEMLLELTRRRLGRRVKLERLTKDGTGDMLGIIFAAEITPEFLEGIYKETEGNPFFIEEVSKALVESGQVWYEAGDWQRAPDMEDVSIPQGVKVAIQSRVSKLSEETQGLLLTAAVIGREFDFQTLDMVTGKDEEFLIDGLEEAINKQLIEEAREGGGEQFFFSHALIPATLREGISGLRRTRLHRQVATAIEELRPGDYERLAYHWGEAGDEKRGLEYTIKAADRARQAYANEDAIRLYSEAISLLAEDDIDRFMLLESRAAVYDVMADRDSQLVDIEAILAIADYQGDDTRRVDALLSLASFYLETEPIKASQPLEQALELARQLGDIGREGRALYYSGTQAHYLFDYYNAGEYFKASASKLAQADLINEKAECLSFLSVVLGFLGDSTSALDAAQEAAALSKESGDRLLEALSIRRLAIAYLNLYQNSQALPIAEQALRMFREIGDISNEMHALNVLGIIKRRLGEFAAAEEDLLEGLRIAESTGNEVGIKWLINNLSFGYNWYMGEYSRTIKLIEVHQDKARQVENETLEIDLQLLKLVEFSRLGMYKKALSIYETHLPYIYQLDEVSQLWNLRRVAILNAELGRYDQATSYLDQVGELCSRISNPFESANLEEITAKLRLMEGGAAHWQEGMEKITGVIAFYRQRNLQLGFGNALFIKAQLHLALVGEDQIHAEFALECTSEALKNLEKEEGYFIMPEQTYFHHSEALRVNNQEKEADDFLRQAYERMMLVAEKIEDKKIRQCYLENVRENREIRAAYHERFG
jgi:predicted Ser/Thr protein kinase